MNNKNGLSKQPKIALVHDYLNQYGGGERVLEALAETWPEAEIYTSIFDRRLMAPWLKIDPERIHTNFVQRLPFAHYLSKHYFFLYPLAFRLQSTEEADVVISISSYASKFIRPKKGGIHIAYINTPPRFLYGYDRELTGYRHRSFDKYLEPVYKILVPPVKTTLRFADQNSVKNIDYLISNSQEIRKRVKQAYDCDSEVIYPPVDIARFAPPPRDTRQETSSRKEFYLIVSRLGGYKKIDIAVKAFNKLGERLKIVGDGPLLKYLKSIAAPNVEFLGRLDDKSVTELFLDCRAVVFPTEEDFGIVPVEAMASGKAVIAFGKAGAEETVLEGKTGVFFRKQTSEALIAAVKEFEGKTFDPEVCRRRANEFSKEVFQGRMKNFVEEKARGLEV